MESFPSPDGMGTAASVVLKQAKQNESNQFTSSHSLQDLPYQRDHGSAVGNMESGGCKERIHDCAFHYMRRPSGYTSIPDIWGETLGEQGRPRETTI